MSRLRQILYPPAWSVTVMFSVALLLAALLPMSLIGYYNNQVSLSSLENTEYRNMALLATSLANRLDQLLIDTGYVADQVSNDPTVVAFTQQAGGVSYDDVARVLDNILFSNPTYEYVYLMDATGDVLISRQLEGLSSIEHLYLQDRAYFKAAIAGDHYIDVLVGRTSRMLGLYFSAPISAPDAKDDIIGVAAIKVQGHVAEDIIESIKIGQEGFAFLIDQDGVIVSHPNRDLYYHSLMALPPKKVRQVVSRFGLADGQVHSLQLDALARDVVRAEQPGHTSYINIDKSEQISGFAPLTQLGWVVVVSEPIAEFAAPLNAVARQSFLSVLVVGVIVAVLALSLARGIARPVRALTQAARELQESGEFDADTLRASAPEHADIGQLVHVFITMAQEVRAREERLKQQVMELRIEIDEAQKQRAVERIVDSEYFEALKEKAQAARRRRRGVDADLAPEEEKAPEATGSVFDVLRSTQKAEQSESENDDPLEGLEDRAQAMRDRYTPPEEDE